MAITVMILLCSVAPESVVFPGTETFQSWEFPELIRITVTVTVTVL